jgi:hypothetical protein
MLRFHDASSGHAGESALVFLNLGTSDSRLSVLITTMQFVCR